MSCRRYDVKWWNFRIFLRHRAGNVAVMSAFLLPVLLLGAALAVDQGSLFFERREAQGLTDLAAITAAANIARANDAALLTMSDNRQRNVRLIDDLATPLGTDEAQLFVERGRYVADPAVDPANRFIAGSEPVNAARVTYRKRGALYFGSAVMEPPVITTVGVAASSAEAAVSVGSRLASLNENVGILNAMLGKLLKADLSLRLIDYRAISDVDVDALTFANGLARELRLTVGTYNDVLAAEATVAQVLRALSASIGHDRDAQFAVQAVLSSLSGTSPLRIPLSHLLDLGSVGSLAIGEQGAALQAAIGVMELIGATAAVANGGRQVELDTGLRLPPLLDVSLKLAVGEPPQNRPWFAIGEAGEVVRTAQIRLYFVAGVPGLRFGSVDVARVRLPILLQVAYAEAQLQGISCPAGQPARVSVDAKPGLFEAWIGEIDDAQLTRFDREPSVRNAELLGALPLIVKIVGSANIDSGNLVSTRLIFSQQEIAQGTVKSTSTSQVVQSLLGSLLSELELKVDVLGLGLGLPSQDAIKHAMERVLLGVTTPVDRILNNVLTALGIKLGEADIRVNGVTCRRAVLVN